MNTIDDLVRMRPIEVAGYVNKDKHLVAFVEEFRSGIDALAERACDDRDFMDRLDVAVLAQGTQDGEIESLARLEFDGAPVALFRHVPEGHPEWTWRLVDTGSADRLVAEILDAVSHGPRMQEAGMNEAAGDLLDFGPNASIDMHSGKVAFSKMTPLMNLRAGNLFSVLYRGEDGAVLIGRREGERDVYTATDGMEAGVRAFVGDVEDKVAGFSHGDGLVMVSVKDGIFSLMGTRGEVKCNLMSGPEHHMTELASGDAAIPEFMSRVRAAGDVLAAQWAETPDESSAPGM